MKPIIITTALLGLLALNLSGCQSVYVTSAKVYLQQNEYEQAKQQLQLALKDNPNDAEAHYYLGDIYARQKDFPKMMTEFNACLAINDKHKDEIAAIKDKNFADAYKNAVETFNGQKYKETIDDLKMATLIRPETGKAWSLMGKTYVNQSQFPEAIEAFKKAVALDTKYENMEDRSLLMKLYFNGNNYEAALNMAEEIYRKDDKNKDAIKTLASSYNQLALKTEDQEKRKTLQSKALGYYQKVLEVLPDNADLNYNMGLLYFDMGRFDEALAQFDKVAALNPQDKEALLQSAQIYVEKKQDYGMAAQYYRKVVALDPTNPGVWNNLGVALLRSSESENNDAKKKALIEEGKEAMKKAEQLRGQK
jgi:tetratricopeptide (TPR) repeat protein